VSNYPAGVSDRSFDLDEERDACSCSCHGTYRSPCTACSSADEYVCAEITDARARADESREEWERGS
jgi:hypothetical protein